jgi:hypothetical protein
MISPATMLRWWWFVLSVEVEAALSSRPTRLRRSEEDEDILDRLRFRRCGDIISAGAAILSV